MKAHPHLGTGTGNIMVQPDSMHNLGTLWVPHHSSVTTQPWDVLVIVQIIACLGC